MIFCIGKSIGVVVMLSSEHDDYRWVTAEEMQSMNTSELFRQAVKKLTGRHPL